MNLFDQAIKSFKIVNVIMLIAAIIYTAVGIINFNETNILVPSLIIVGFLAFGFYKSQTSPNKDTIWFYYAFAALFTFVLAVSMSSIIVAVAACAMTSLSFASFTGGKMMMPKNTYY